jgi:hypothetical protein
MLEGKTIFLHIGIGKTGTTALQKTLFHERKGLLKLGYFYPNVGIQSGAHHRLAKLGCQEVPENLKELYVKLAKIFDRHHVDKMIMSSENFCFMQRGYVQWISEVFSDANVKIVFYVRNQLEWIPSAFSERVKTLSNYEGSIESFLQKYERAFNFETRLENWVKYFGDNAILAKLYDRRIVQDTAHDFLNLVGLRGYEPEHKKEVNPSLLPEFTQILIMLDKHGINPWLRKRIVRLLLYYSPQFKHASSLKLAGPELREKIIGIYRESNARIAKKYLSKTECQYFLEDYSQR